MKNNGIFKRKKTAPVNVLAKRLFVSEATMRRDLSELERKGLVKRLHGGAILLDGANQELPLYLRERQNTDAKRIISEKASHHIVEGQTIFLDASSTAQYLIKYFENYQNLTIITNGLKTAQELNSLSHRIYCTGGLLLHNSSAYVGDFAADFVRNFNADIMFSQAVEYRKAVRSPMHPGKRLTFVRSCCNKAANIFFYVIIIKSVRSIATTYVMYHSWTIISPTCNYSE